MCDIDETEIDLRFDDLCRLCASYDNVKISLFSEEGRKRQLRKKIQSCLPFKVDENDGLPKSLCYKCVYNLETTYEFRYKCILVNRNLEKHLRKKERETHLSNVSSGQSRRIHPEVSIFAIPTERSEDFQNSDESYVAPIGCDEASPNPLDFLEVGVNSEDVVNYHAKRQNTQEGKKPYSWKADKRWLSVEHKPLRNDATNVSKADLTKYLDCVQDENSSRRKSCNPRKIARESEENDGVSSSNTLLNYEQNTRASVVANAFPSMTSNNDNSIRNENVAATECATSEPFDDDNGGQQDEHKTFTCLLCEKSFSLRSSLNKHFSTAHGIEPYEMMSQAPTVSPTSFVKQLVEDGNDEELEHMMEQETVIFCEVCRREFQDRASLWLHMVHAHREEAAVSCGICLKICCDNITLIEHVNTAHSGDKAVVQRRYSCQVCGRQHDSRQKLLKHATLHTLIDNQGQTIQPEEMVSLNNAFAPRECSICHKKFFNEEKLNHHTQNFHNDTNDTTLSPSTVYKCELCASAHATRMDRWWHMYHSHGEDARVTCDRDGCRKIFVSQTLKDEHAKTHHQTQGNFTNTCEICGKLWESRTVFYKHMMNVHPKCLPTICGICMKIFSNVPELRSHVQGDHPPLEESGGICCDVCGRPYAERSKMLRHRRVHNVTDGVPSATSTAKRKDDLVCNFCPDVTFETYEQIADHRRTVHQLFVCDLCPKFYNGNNHLWKHVSKQHKGDPTVTCNLCLRTSASRAHLERHKIKYHSDPLDKLSSSRTASTPASVPAAGCSAYSSSSAAAAAAAAAAAQPPPPHKCALCGKVFRIRSLLKKHSKSCKGVKPIAPKAQPVNGVFPCSRCPKVFQLPNVLAKHVKNSHLQHTCEVCEVEPKVAFDTKKALLQHIRQLHPNHHELACDVPGCGKVLRLKADLKKHKLEHVRGYFTYICEICGDMFSNRKKLKKHLQTYHKNDVKHLCSVCVAIHQSMDELVQHVHSTHTFVLHRPYTCQICGKCLSVSSKVVEHIVKVHGKEYKPCKICWKVFADERDFDQHVENHPPTSEDKSSTTAMATPTPTPTPTLVSDSDTPSSSRNKVAQSRQRSASRSGLPQELLALGVRFETDGSVKRSSEDDGYCDDNGGKRLRRKHRCVWCKETFRSTDELKEHKIAQHANPDHRNDAGQPTDYEDDESQQRQPEKNYVFSSAAAVAATAVTAAAPAPIEKHESNKFERWTDIRPIACDCCDKIWNSKKQLWQHLIRSHPYESQYACGICLQVCRDYFDLFYHLDSRHSNIVNENVNRFSCFICGHYHNSQSKLDKHFLLHKNAPARCEYTCQYCLKVYKSVAFYRDHIRSHEVRVPESKAKPTSEFSGFSINHILATKDDRHSPTERTTASFDDGAYDVKYEKTYDNDDDDDNDNDDDDDLVEELSEDEDDDDDMEEDGDSCNLNAQQTDPCSSQNTFDRSSHSADKYSSAISSRQRIPPAKVPLVDEGNHIRRTSIEDSVRNESSAFLNGGKHSAIANDRGQIYNLHNNQRRRSSLENEKHNLLGTSAEDHFQKMTENV